MSHDDNIAERGVLYVFHPRVHPVGDGNRRQVSRVAAATRQVDGEHAQFWFLTS
jgi:hypothetical protein